MSKHHLLVAGAAAAATIAYFWVKTPATAQTIPGLAQVFNLGYNFGAYGSFSVSSPVAAAV